MVTLESTQFFSITFNARLRSDELIYVTTKLRQYLVCRFFLLFGGEHFSTPAIMVDISSCRDVSSIPQSIQRNVGTF